MSDFCVKLISRLRRPIVSTSANISGKPAPAYFNESSFEVVTPEKKEERLITQLAIKIAKEKMDPMFQELLKAASEAKRLQDAIVEKYKDEASSKSNQITGKKSNETVYDPEPEEDEE